MDTGGILINIKSEDFYEDIANDIEILFDTSNYDEKIKDRFQQVKTKK